MTRLALYASILLSLSGCLEDKESILAECRLKYENKKDSADPISDVLLCMQAQGYDFEAKYHFADGNPDPNNRCYNMVESKPKAVPMEPVYQLSTCYKHRPFSSRWDS